MAEIRLSGVRRETGLGTFIGQWEAMESFQQTASSMYCREKNQRHKDC
jgi:hypothetical protein